MKHGKAKRGEKTSLYNVWIMMRHRCRCETCKDFKYYGGRGIDCCKEWDDFSRFEEWALLNGYEEGLEIDRVDNSRGYDPNNCRWVSKSVNEYNRGIFKNNTTGRTGVARKGKKYIAYIDKNKKRMNLGTFGTVEEAAAARETAEIRIYGTTKERSGNNADH